MPRVPLRAVAGAIEPLVREVEAATSAEIVVVVAGSSSRYTHVTGWAAAVAAWAATAFLCWSPWSFTDLWIPLDVAAVAAATAGLVATAPNTRLRLAGGAARERAVAHAAEAAFTEEAVYATRDRTGVLVYVSVLERTVLLRADSAIQARVPAGAWNEVAARLRTLESVDGFTAGFRAMGALLATHLPRSADDVNESADAPRVRA